VEGQLEIAFLRQVFTIRQAGVVSASVSGLWFLDFFINVRERSAA